MTKLSDLKALAQQVVKLSEHKNKMSGARDYQTAHASLMSNLSAEGLVALIEVVIVLRNEHILLRNRLFDDGTTCPEIVYCDNLLDTL